LHSETEKTSSEYMRGSSPFRILLTSGASCPDAVVERVIERLCELKNTAVSVAEMTLQFKL
jgi:4-hydroxy-3-methylbut-2-en-1-yl diphosphate reductase